MSISTGSTDFLGGGAGFGFGGFGGIAPVGIIGLNTLFDRNRGNCEGDGGTNNNTVFGAAVLSKLGTIEGAIPLAAANVQNSILEQTIGLNSTLNENNIAQLQASANLKDTVQNTGVALLQATNAQGEATRALITQLNTDNLNRLLTVADLDRRDERSFARTREVEVNVTQSVNQQQAQQQQQAQFSQLVAAFNNLANDLQVVKQTTSNINFGVMGANAQNPTATNNSVK